MTCSLFHRNRSHNSTHIWLLTSTGLPISLISCVTGTIEWTICIGTQQVLSKCQYSELITYQYRSSHLLHILCHRYNWMNHLYWHSTDLSKNQNSELITYQYRLPISLISCVTGTIEWTICIGTQQIYQRISTQNWSLTSTGLPISVISCVTGTIEWTICIGTQHVLSKCQ